MRQFQNLFLNIRDANLLKFAVLVVMIFLGFGVNAEAGRNFPIARSSASQSLLPSFARVLSYDELMQLSPAKRASYIRGLRLLFSNLETLKKNSKFAAASGLNEQSYAIANLLRIYDQFVPVAEAAEPARAASAAPAREPGVPYFGNGIVSCSGDYRAYKVYGAVGDNRANNYVCLSNVRGCPPNLEGKCKPAEKALQPQLTPCGSGFVPVKQDSNGAYFCATEKSFARTPQNAQRNLRLTSYLPVLSRPGFIAKFMGLGLGRYFKETGPSLQSIDAKIATRNGARAFDQKPRVYGPWESPTEHCPVIGSDGVPKDVAPPEYAASVRARCASYAQYGDSKPLPPLVKVEPPKPKPVAKAVPKPAVRVVEQPVATTAKRPVTQSPSTTAAQLTMPSRKAAARSSAVPVWESVVNEPSAEVAPPPAPAAAPAAAAAANIAIVPTEGEIAVPAEMNSCSPDSSATPTCSAEQVESARKKYVSDSNPDCIYAGSVVGYESGMKRSFKCEPPRSFCFGSSDCKAQSGENLKPNFTCGSKGVICNPLLFGVKSDGKTPFCVERDANATLSCESATADETEVVQPLDQNHAGIREAWNDFADRVFQLCHANETAKALHCAECDVIKKRLFALNVAARDVKNCGAAIKFEAANCSEDGKCVGRPGASPKTTQPKATTRSVSAGESPKDSTDEDDNRSPAGITPKPSPNP